LWSEAKQGRALEVRFGIRLATRDVLGSDHAAWSSNACRANANVSKWFCARRNDRPAVGRKGGQELYDARQRNYPVDVKNLAAFDFPVLRFVIGVGKKLPNGGDAGATVGSMDRFVGIEAVLESPPGPNARHSGRGIDQDSIHIKQERFAGDLWHRVR
jgi:hypothetical protein